MSKANAVPDGYMEWLQRYFAEVVPALLEDASTTATVEESKKPDEAEITLEQCRARKQKLDAAFAAAELQTTENEPIDAVNRTLALARRAENAITPLLYKRPVNVKLLQQALNLYEKAIAALDQKIKSEPEKRAFERKMLNAATPIEIARGLSHVDGKAHAAMEMAWDQAIDSFDDGNYEAASLALDQALDQAEIISRQHLAAREEFLERKPKLQGDFELVMARIRDRSKLLVRATNP